MLSPPPTHRASAPVPTPKLDRLSVHVGRGQRRQDYPEDQHFHPHHQSHSWPVQLQQQQQHPFVDQLSTLNMALMPTVLAAAAALIPTSLQSIQDRVHASSASSMPLYSHAQEYAYHGGLAPQRTMAAGTASEDTGDIRSKLIQIREAVQRQREEEARGAQATATPLAPAASEASPSPSTMPTPPSTSAPTSTPALIPASTPTPVSATAPSATAAPGDSLGAALQAALAEAAQLRRDKDALREEKALLETELALARSAAGDAERTSAIAQTASERLQHENEALRAQITDFDAAMREGARLRAGLEADRAKAIAQAEQVAEEAVRVRKEHAAVVEDLERRLSARDREVEVCVL